MRAELVIKYAVGKSSVSHGREKGDGINVTTYLGAFMDLEAVVRRHPWDEEESEKTAGVRRIIGLLLNALGKTCIISRRVERGIRADWRA